MKLLAKKNNSENYSDKVSVPLRGNGYETRLLLNRLARKQAFLVSVPLRGNGYETVREKLLDASHSIERFRPLAGKWV